MKQISKKLVFIASAIFVIAVFAFDQQHQKQALIESASKAVVTPTQALTLAPKIEATNTTTKTSYLGNSIHVPVLMYHHVGPILDPQVADMYVSTQDFEAQVIYFKDKGYTPVSLDQVYGRLVNGKFLPGKPIVFTFDDGYKDVFVNAVPILQKYGSSGSFAIATELLGRPGYAVWDDVIFAHDAGMEIISHTENHLDLTSSKYSEFDLHREIFESKKVLEGKLGATVDFFVYPYGAHNDKVSDLVKQAGYKMAFTTAFGMDLNMDQLLTEPRVRVHGQDGLEKLKKIFEPLPRTVTSLTNP